MQNSATKLAVIAGVIGVVLLALMQAQRGMHGSGDATENVDASVVAPVAQLGDGQTKSIVPELPEFGPGGQDEPAFASIPAEHSAPPASFPASRTNALPLASQRPQASDSTAREGERTPRSLSSASRRPSAANENPFDSSFETDDGFFDDSNDTPLENVIPVSATSPVEPDLAPVPEDFSGLNAEPPQHLDEPTPSPRDVSAGNEDEPPSPVAPSEDDRVDFGEPRFENDADLDDRDSAIPAEFPESGFPESGGIEREPAAPPASPEREEPNLFGPFPGTDEIERPQGDRGDFPASDAGSRAPRFDIDEREAVPRNDEPAAIENGADELDLFDEPPASHSEGDPARSATIPESEPRAPETETDEIPYTNVPSRDSSADLEFRPETRNSHEPLRSLPKLPLAEESPDEASPSIAAETEEARRPSLEPRRLTEPERLPQPANAARIEPFPATSTTTATSSNTSASDQLLGSGSLADGAPEGPQQPRLTLEKIAPPNAVLGQPMIYSIIVRNVGKTRAAEVVVEDPIPAGTKLTGTIPRAELVGKTLTWRLGTIEPGGEKKISVRVTPLEEGEIGSVATVNFVAEVASRTKVGAAKLEMSMQAPERARLGEPVVFQYDVKNVGEAPAGNVILRDMIPDGLSHPSGDDLEYAIGELAAGEAKHVRLTLTAARAGRTVNRAVVTANGNIAIEGTSAVEILGPQLSLSRTGPRRQFVGRETIFTTAVTNDSDRPVAGAKVAEIVPVGFDFVKASGGGRYDAANRTVVWSLGEIAAGRSAVLKVELRPTATGDLQSVVELIDTAGAKSRTTSQTTIVGYAALGLDVESERTPALVGDKLPITVIVRNEGTTVATGVNVTLDIPQELELVSIEAPVEFRRKGNRIVFEPISEVKVDNSIAIQTIFRAARAGDARVKVAIEADQMQRPLTREEAAPILEATP